MKRLFFVFLCAVVVALPAQAQQQEEQPAQQVAQRKQQVTQPTPYNVQIAKPGTDKFTAGEIILSREGSQNLISAKRETGRQAKTSYERNTKGILQKKDGDDGFHRLYTDSQGRSISHPVKGNNDDWIFVAQSNDEKNKKGQYRVRRTLYNRRTRQTTTFEVDVPRGGSLKKAIFEIENMPLTQVNSELDKANKLPAACSYGEPCN